MPSFRTAAVAEVLSARPGLQRVALDDGRRAYVLTQLVGDVAVGDRVVVNTTAVDLGLGTGGWDVVHWNLARERWSAPGPGHIMKLRYTSLQIDAGAAEESDGYDEWTSLAGRPVVVVTVHSQLAAVAAAFKHQAPGRRLAYVMTDASSLPLALSDLVADLTARGLVDATVTCGQAFGGDFEAVSPTSALHVACSMAGAEAVVIGTGPGVVGTGTEYGTSAEEVPGLLQAAARRGATPVLALRWSDADERERHRGLSHHSEAALAGAPPGTVLPVPAGRGPLREGTTEVEVPDLDLGGVTTMGRTADQDPGFFAFAAAAGVAAARILGP